MYEVVAAKHVAALTTVLGELDTLVFTGGVGEHAARFASASRGGWPTSASSSTRRRTMRTAPVISSPGAAVTVRVEPTDGGS